MRAAVLAASERTGQSDGAEPIPRFSSTRERNMAAKIVLLAPGVRAAALGRGALRPGGPEWAAAGLGNPQTITGRLPHWALIVLESAGNERLFDGFEIPGPIDVPVFADPADGRVLALDEEAIAAEVAPFRDTAMKIWKREEGWLRTPRIVLGAPRSALRLARTVGGSLPGEIAGIVADLRPAPPPGPEAGERPSDASHEPIEGVGYRTWVTVRAGLVRDDVHPTHVGLYATHRGVPADRWPAVDAAWSARAAADPRLGTWSAYDLRRLEPTGARW